jgi:Tol biopolymer transport system component
VTGERIGAYEILTQLGAGGMGAVYRAHDRKLNRDVAIKVVLPEVANDPDRLARFSREAQVLASLNHPNIAHIYGIEEANGVTALVMELVEGEDLAQRLHRGAIPIADALPIARQIAEALEAAHDHGIIHRDLKPANIKLRPDGTVKVLDFGLAKAIDPTGGSSVTAMNSPTLSIHATEAGLILGTAAYMSPEQAAGKTVDKRSDLWAFGAVVFEMLTGRPTFAGETISHVLAAVLKDEPDWDALPPATPAPIRRLLHRALEKDRKRRLPDAASARLDIDDALTPSRHTAESGALTSSAGVRPRRAWVQLLPWAVALLALAIAALGWSGMFRGPAMSPARPIRFTLADLQGVVPIDGNRTQIAISPDGSRLAFVLDGDDGQRRIWIRSLEALSAQPLPGTENALTPFWSPDSRALAFFADGKLKRIELGGAASPQPVGDFPSSIGATWSAKGVILVASRRGIDRIAAGGGEPIEALAPVPNTNDELRWPSFLPDGQHFIYVVSSSDANRRGVFVGSLDSRESTRLMDGDSSVAFASPGYLIFAREATVFARGFDADRLQLTGEPFPVAERVTRGLPRTYAAFDVSQTGVLIYQADGDREEGTQQLVWLDRTGRQVGTVGSPGEYRVPMLSVDGSKIAFDRVDPKRGTRDVWSIDVARGFLTRLTTHPANDFAPLWSPDGTRVMFASDRDGPLAALYQRVGTSGGSDELILGSGGDKRAHDWSRDGKYLLYGAGREGLWALPMGNERRPVRFSPEGESSETRPQFSPDARFVAYDSAVSGRREIYVRPFPPTGQEWRVSANGGYEARWRADGKELFYVSLDGTLMASDVKAQPGFDAGVARTLFESPLKKLGSSERITRSSYAVSGNGQRFLFTVRIGETSAPPITIVLNWHAPVTNQNGATSAR